MTSEQDPVNYIVYIEDGIVYYEFSNELTIQNVLAAEKLGFVVLQENHIRVVPTIISFKNIDQSRVSIGFSDLSKIVTMHDIMKYASGLWFVGAEKQVKILSEALNIMFLGGHIRFVATLDEAKKEAKIAARSSNTDDSILEQ
jgi:hypothetical protein